MAYMYEIKKENGLWRPIYYGLGAKLAHEIKGE